MKDLMLREASALDAGKTGAILSQFTDETEWLPRVHSRAQEIGFMGLMIERGWVSVALYQDEIVGFIACHDGEIHGLYVTAQARGQGCGAALLRAAQLQNSALGLWTFQANTQAVKFYQYLGFQEISRSAGGGNDVQLPDIRMEWKKEAA